MTEKTNRDRAERDPVLKPPADKEDEATVMDPEINLRHDLNHRKRSPAEQEDVS